MWLGKTVNYAIMLANNTKMSLCHVTKAHTQTTTKNDRYKISRSILQRLLVLVLNKNEENIE